MTTVTGLDWWLDRDATNDENVNERYWEDWASPHRENISAALRLFVPFESVYEVGTFSGPNLRRIRADYPKARLGGCEPCPGARAFAEEKLGITLSAERIDEYFEDSLTKWDVVISCYTLAYVSPDRIWIALYRMGQMTNKIVLLEPCAWGSVKKGVCRDDYLKEWRHDYWSLLDSLGWGVTWAWPIEPVQNANALIMAQYNG